MDRKVIEWLVRAVATLLLIPTLAACITSVAAAPDVTGSTGARAGTPAPASDLDTTALDVFVRRMMGIYDVPGVGLGIVEHGQIVYINGYGVRDITTGAPVTPATQFAVGSITK